MSLQAFEEKNQEIREAFETRQAASPEAFATPLHLAWSNWGFGQEPLEVSVRRLADNGISWIELHGNRYGPDLGYRTAEAKKILDDHGVRCCGICGMFSPDCDLSSNRPHVRQRAMEYVRRQVEMAHDFGGGYLLVVPGAVGRNAPIDAFEFDRSVETLRELGDLFVQAGVRAAVEPIRAAEVSFCHTIADAEAYIRAVDHPGVQHINGDLYHMLAGEAHIGDAIREAGSRLTNLHMADSNRDALGRGQLDLDTVLRALYLIGYNEEGRFCTPEPLGPGGDPYPAMYGKPDPERLDHLVETTVRTFRAREEAIKA